ncbi:MAG: ABC transporter ATP-binding protein [Sphaerochaetaceae bacterium]|nr:ABC transporter ATP-binding protein [Sphaerochaetaceae bacterium]
MPEIRLEHVTKRWGKFYAVDDLNLVIGNNDFVTLLGPSGCGKTTTLRMIAGLETPTSGKISIGDRVVFDSSKGINVPPNKRKVGFLFQNYALWPNMTVYQNISFGLHNIKEELPTIDFEAKEATKLVEILSDIATLKAHIAESKDKSGKLDEKKAQLRLIDSYTISMMTAKKLLALKDDNAMAALLESSKKKLEERKNAIAAAGQTLDADFHVLQNGTPVTSVRKLTDEEIDLSVRRVSRLVKIGMFMDRYPAELSGGQQQRVAIARTLAPEPSVLFMDEPLSNLDAKLRLEMRYELQRLHVDTGSTFVYVTHDQMEAMTLATRICLMNNGVLQQYDPPLDVYNMPNNLFVADFVGNPSVNFIDAQGKINADGTVSLEMLNGRKFTFKPAADFDFDAWYKARDEHKAAMEAEEKAKMELKGYVEKGNKDEYFNYHIAKVDESEIQDEVPRIDRQSFVIGVRPECIDIDENGSVCGEIFGAMPTGMESTIKVNVDEFLLTGVIFGNSKFTIGSKVNFAINTDRIMLFDAISGRLVTLGSLN